MAAAVEQRAVEESVAESVAILVRGPVDRPERLDAESLRRALERVRLDRQGPIQDGVAQFGALAPILAEAWLDDVASAATATGVRRGGSRRVHLPPSGRPRRAVSPAKPR